MYIRFFRMAERRIVEKSGEGIISFISNYSWLDGLSFTGMRERYLEAFDSIWIDISTATGSSPARSHPKANQTSETVFAMQGSSPGIKVGTAIATLIVKRG